MSDEKVKKLNKTEDVYGRVLKRITALCEEADAELKEIQEAG